MARKVVSKLEKDMDDFINDYLSGMFRDFVTAGDDGVVEEDDIFELYCDIGNCFDIFCEKLHAEICKDEKLLENKNE